MRPLQSCGRGAQKGSLCKHMHVPYTHQSPGESLPADIYNRSVYA